MRINFQELWLMSATQCIIGSLQLSSSVQHWEYLVMFNTTNLQFRTQITLSHNNWKQKQQPNESTKTEKLHLAQTHKPMRLQHVPVPTHRPSSNRPSHCRVLFQCQMQLTELLLVNRRKVSVIPFTGKHCRSKWKIPFSNTAVVLDYCMTIIVKNKHQTCHVQLRNHMCAPPTTQWNFRI